jgi:hypothetical protein
VFPVESSEGEEKETSLPSMRKVLGKDEENSKSILCEKKTEICCLDALSLFLLLCRLLLFLLDPIVDILSC